MNTHPLLAAAFATVGLAVSGCSTLVPFTQELRDEHHLSAPELRNLQFYVSNRIVLRREVERDAREVTPGHRLRLTSGRSIEEVVVEEGTPGVAVAVGPSVMSISFEPGVYMDFAVTGGRPVPEPVALTPNGVFAEPPDPFPGNRTVAPSADALFTGNYWLAVSPSGTVPYGAKLFSPADTSGQAHLLINAESLERVVKSRKVVPGMLL